LLTNKDKEIYEYKIPNLIRRVIFKNSKIIYLIRLIFKKRIEIFFYQYSKDYEINLLNNIKKIKVIFYQHQSLFYWLYFNYTSFKQIYKSYRNSKYIISLIHLENDYIFKKWSLKSIFMNNFITYEYNAVIPSDLSSNNILMIGRADNKFKRFELGIQAMEYLYDEIPLSKMIIISNLSNIFDLKNLITNLNLYNYIIFYDYSTTPDIYLKNISLHIFPSISESFGLVLAESKIYGIPNILIGLNYISIAKGGNIIIYDDKPEYIAKESLKILINNKLKQNLGKLSRNNMKKFKNELLLKNWINLILSIYNNDDYYKRLKLTNKKISEKEALISLKKQIQIFNLIKTCFKKNITISNIENFTFMENIKDI